MEKSKSKNPSSNRGYRKIKKMVMDKKIVKTKKDIRSFLIASGFKPAWCKESVTQEYIKPIADEDLYVYQINGEDITDIESLDEPVFFSENGKDPAETPMYRYSKQYPNLKAMVEGERKRGVVFKGLRKWILK